MVASGAPLLVDLGLVTVVAGAAALLFHRYRQPLVVGFLLAGILVGPHGPLRLQSLESVQTLAELGIVFLMFSIGLEFRLGRLYRSGGPAVGAALAGMATTAIAAYLLGRALGWPALDAVFMGAILAISSTVIAAKAILERGEQNQRWAELALGVLIVQDVAAVAILALLGAAPGGEVGVFDVLGVLGRIATFAMAAVVLGLLLVPPLVNRLARGQAHEVMVLAMAGLAMGVAVLALLLGFSPALGAFLIGAVVAEATEAWAAEQRVRPLRDLFTAIFFVSIGMLLDPAVLAQHWPAALAFAGVMVVAKVAAHVGPAFLLGAPPREAFTASLALAQIGEFSFVIAALGLAIGAVSGFVLPVTVAVAMMSALWTPYLLRAAEPLYQALAARAPRGLGAGAQAYAAWRDVRARRPRRFPAEARRLAGRAALNATAVVLLLLAASAGSSALAQFVTLRGLTDRALALLPWLAGGVLALPFGYNAARAVWGLVELRRGARVHHISPHTRTAALVLGSAALVFLAFLLAAPFLPPMPLILLSMGAFLGAAIVLWESMVRLHRNIEGALESAMGAAHGEAREEVLGALRDQYRWGADVERFPLEPGTAAAYAALRDLDLGARTGATLLAVQRRERTIVNPPPGLSLEPGDGLVLLGDAGQLERARAVLGAALAADPHEPRIAEVRVEPGSRLAGRTIAETGLRRRTGATIVGIQRGEQRMPNPRADTRLEPGDLLLVVGAEEQVREAGALGRAPQAPG